MAHPITRIPNFTYDTLSKELDLTAEEKKALGVLLSAYLDDFWQNGTGSLLPPASGGHSSTVNQLLEKRFVFRNVIRECVGRVAGAFFGKTPNWKFQIDGQEIGRPKQRDDDEEDADLIKIDKALADFWTRRAVADVLSRALEFRLAFGRGGIRIFLPTKFKRQNLSSGEDQLIKFPDIVTAIEAMRVEFIPPIQGKLLDDGGEYFSMVRYQVRKNWETRDVAGVIEFSFVDDEEMTVVGTIEERAGTDELEDSNLSSPFDLNGWPTYNEFKGLPYVTRALYTNNQLVNLALTCAGFSLVDNGFGEMILTNVALETESRIVDGGQTVEVPKKIIRGGGAIQNFVGVETVDEMTGSTRIATPGVTFRQPVSMDTFSDGYDMAYAACLAEAGQLYALISGDATASGESRIQALADFVLKISRYKSEVDEQGSWLMTVVLLWAAALSNTSLRGYKVVFDSRMHVASLSTEEKNLVMSMREKGAISRETERVLLDVNDPELEEELILQEQSKAFNDTSIDEFSEKLDVGLKMQSLGMDITTIQRFLGFSDLQIQEMQRISIEAEAELLARIEESRKGGNPSPDDVGEFDPQPIAE